MVTATASLGRLGDVLGYLRSLDATFPIQGWQVFLAVAQSPGISQPDLEETVGISQSAVSRHVFALSKFAAFNRPGMGMVEAIDNPMNRREKVVNLTPKGERVAEKLAQLLE